MTPLPFAALITLLTIAVMFWTAINVGRARVKYEVKAPATSGHELPKPGSCKQLALMIDPNIASFCSRFASDLS